MLHDICLQSFFLFSFVNNPRLSDILNLLALNCLYKQCTLQLLAEAFICSKNKHNDTSANGLPAVEAIKTKRLMMSFIAPQQ